MDSQLSKVENSVEGLEIAEFILAEELDGEALVDSRLEKFMDISGEPRLQLFELPELNPFILVFLRRLIEHLFAQDPEQSQHILRALFLDSFNCLVQNLQVELLG